MSFLHSSANPTVHTKHYPQSGNSSSFWRRGVSPEPRFAESQTVVASSGLVQMFMRDAKLHSGDSQKGGSGVVSGRKRSLQTWLQRTMCGPWAWSFCLSH